MGLVYMDVKSAFLNGDLKEEVYVWEAPGFTIAAQETKVLLLHKVFYGVTIDCEHGTPS